MKKFIFTILSVSVFFVGLGGLVERAGAKFKSDDKALAVVAQARQAIGGDAAINGVRSLTIKAETTQTFNFDGAPRTEQGEMNIALQLPDKFVKMVRIGKEDNASGNVDMIRRVDKIVVKNKTGDASELAPLSENGETGVIVKHDDDKNADGKQIKRVFVKHGENWDGQNIRQNDLLRTTFSLLLSAPEGSDVSYTYAGEDTVDGNRCDVVSAAGGGSSFKLYIDQSTHLPLMMSYQGFAPRIFKIDEKSANSGDTSYAGTVIVNTDQKPKSDAKTFKVITGTSDAPGATAEFQVKFSDYRSTGGVQLPYKWTQTIDGKPDQTVDVTSYEINPANIEEKFQQPDQKIMIRMKKPE